MSGESTRWEKLGLLGLAGASVVGLIWIALRALKVGTIDPNTATLLGVIVTGLVAYGKDIVAAIRGYSMSAQLGKVTDQLAASGPAVTQPPADVVDAANQVAGAAADEADAIGGAKGA